MKSGHFIFLVAVFVFTTAFVSSCGQDDEESEESSDTFTDSRDGQKYRKVSIGGLVWMGENLNYKISMSWCYNSRDDYCQRYGRLYDWNTATKACPKGWRLPNNMEWEDLITAADNGAKISSHYDWRALSGGAHYSDGDKEIGELGYWWSDTEFNESKAYYYYTSYRELKLASSPKTTVGYSVRCVQGLECGRGVSCD